MNYALPVCEFNSTLVQFLLPHQNRCLNFGALTFPLFIKCVYIYKRQKNNQSELALKVRNHSKNMNFQIVFVTIVSLLTLDVATGAVDNLSGKSSCWNLPAVNVDLQQVSEFYRCTGAVHKSCAISLREGGVSLAKFYNMKQRAGKIPLFCFTYFMDDP